jgi:predicted heme/steroid binding protein
MVSMSLRVFTMHELSQYDGTEGQPAYIAFQGKVYDVTRSFLWRNGKHQVLHWAGSDLTKDMKQAPHRPDVLIKFPVVGVLTEKLRA